ncbi:MAG TPA: hypothetical protein VJG49_01035 [Candidatus Nanoarchaeia archaeon]|nr:hypothetical protein [Candidatus Nanoarchaeia archaeon]
MERYNGRTKEGIWLERELSRLCSGMSFPLSVIEGYLKASPAERADFLNTIGIQERRSPEPYNRLLNLEEFCQGLS